MIGFDSESLRRFHQLALAVRRSGGARLLQTPQRRSAWGGTDLAGRRDYVPGDDYRYIDWRLCARRDELLSKVFRGEADRHFHLLLDCSASMGLGRPPKFDAARQLAVLLGTMAIADGARVGLAAFSGRVVAELPSLSSMSQVPKLARFLQRLELETTPTNLAAVAQGFVRRQRPAPTIVISDLHDSSGFQVGLDLLRAFGYQPRVVHLFDRRESEPDLVGDTELFDVERQTIQRVTITERTLAQYRMLFFQFLELVRSYCARHGMECLQLPAEMPSHAQLLCALGQNARRQA